MGQRLTAQKDIKSLILKFRQNEDGYKSGSYNETQLRREFLDPFFEALGWDVANKQGLAEQYKDVIHEDAIKVGEQTKAPDYSFRVGGQRKFFVEAKKPSVSIKEDIGPAYQIRRYSWSAKLPLAILSDFEELAVYDCRQKPKPVDKASLGRVAFYTYEQYLEKFDEIYDLFSKEAVLKGTFDKFAQADAKKKGTTEVDKEFLKDIEHWREILAKSIALRNDKLSNDDLNYSVQTIIDRIIFLRICEDRDLEASETLKNLLSSENIYKKLVNVFKQADDRYNAGLFDFNKDQITTRLKIDNKTLSEIIGQMYYPASPYVFSQMPIEILGQVYEQFLGKVIRLTTGHHAKVEEKPEVRKSGGVYYTPQYIVDYIVKNTVGELVKDKTPKEIESINILDPACGSGSFLIGAYKYLLEYHLNWYMANEPKKYPKAVFTDGRGAWRLTTQAAKKILLNNIFGVDIDSQAVEVTKLSLLLKVLENESREGIEQQLKIFKERALPNIDGNIKCGNSLIGPDFYEGQLSLQDTVGTRRDVSDNDEGARINPFDWKREFPAIIQRGGFNAIIGNPPYHSVKLMNNDSKGIFYRYYKVGTNRFNLFGLFIERSAILLNQGGLLGHIIPSSMLANSQYLKLRTFILDNYSISEIVDFKGGVFENANVETMIIIMRREVNVGKRNITKINILYNIRDFIKGYFSKTILLQKDLMKSDNCVIEIGTLQQISTKKTEKLSNIAVLYNGINTGNIADKIITSERTKHSKPLIDGKNVQRYEPPEWQGKYVIYDAEYVEKLRQELARKGLPWTARIIKKENYFEKNKIIIQRIRNLSLSRRLVLTYDDKGFYTSINIGVIVLSDSSPYNLKYLLGILNSTLLNAFYKKRFHNIQIKNDFLETLPIRIIDFRNNEDIKQHNRMVALVDQMLNINKQLPLLKNPNEKEAIARQIAATDKQIDKLVYELYGLTEEEIEVVEGE